MVSHDLPASAVVALAAASRHRSASLGARRHPLAEHSGGWGGIRTHETLAGLPVFKTGAFNRSATHPSGVRYWAGVPPATGPARAQRECGGIVHSQANWAERQGLRVS